jgi:hypothetical protein
MGTIVDSIMSMAVIVTAVVKGYKYYRNQQQKLEDAERKLDKYLFSWADS